jgi:hypothetical protein
MKKVYKVLACCLFLAACAPKKQLYKDVSSEQLEKDKAECANEGLKQMHIGAMENMLIEADKNEQVKTNCFISKGYTWREKPSDEVTAKRKEIEDRYIAAKKLENEKMKSISDYVVQQCRPLPDKEYIECLVSKNADFISISIFPDLRKMLHNERKEYEQQLVRKEITREEFKESVGKLVERFNKTVSDRMKADWENGVYTGKY